MIKLRSLFDIETPTDDEYLETYTPGEVKAYKLTEEELQEVWRKYGPPKKSRKTHSLTKELLMKRLYLQKRTVGQIAFEFKVSPYLVKKLIEQWGLKEKEEGQCMSG